MAGEIPDLKNKARRVKNLALTRAIEILEKPESVDKELYEQTYLTALKNSVPRSQEITGEDGERLIPIPILSGTTNVQIDHSDKQDSEAQETN
jgi:hypothetical protein